MNHGLAKKADDNLRRMNQREAVIEAMRANGGYATLGCLYKTALKIPGVGLKTRIAFSAINRIVRDVKRSRCRLDGITFLSYRNTERWRRA